MNSVFLKGKQLLVERDLKIKKIVVKIAKIEKVYIDKNTENFSCFFNGDKKLFFGAKKLSIKLKKRIYYK